MEKFGALGRRSLRSRDDKRAEGKLSVSGTDFPRGDRQGRLDVEFRPLERCDAKLSQFANEPNYGADRFDLISVGSTAYDSMDS